MFKPLVMIIGSIIAIYNMYKYIFDEKEEY